MLFPDKINLTDVDKSGLGEETRTTVSVSCRIEDETKIAYGQNGEPTRYNTLFLLPRGTSVKKGDEIQITEHKGVTITGAKQQEVKALHIAGNMCVHHIEVWV